MIPKSATQMFNDKHIPNNFPKCKAIQWADVLAKLEWENANKPETIKYLGPEIVEGVPNKQHLPTFIMHTDHYPFSVKTAFDEIDQIFQVKAMHLYVSFGKDAPTFGAHRDQLDVLLVGGIGEVDYKVEGLGDELVTLKPGDGLYIPKGLEHEAIIKEARATLSFEV